MNLKRRKWVILVAIGLIPILTGCEGCDKKKKYVAPPPAPSAPSNLSATPVSSTEVHLSWKDNSTNEKGFYLYRKTTGNYGRIGIFSANTTSCKHINCTPQTTYWYKVTAYNDGGESASSNEASATTLPEGLAPVAPSNLIATAISCEKIKLTWQDNSDDENGFKVYRSFGGTNFEEIVSLGPNITSHIHFQYSGSTYWYYVSAYNSFGSNSSNSVSVTTPVAVEILNYHMEEEYLEYWEEWQTDIIGNVRNNTDRILDITMAGKFFDYNDVMVGKHYDLLWDVGAGETWQFEISYWGERIKRVEAWVDDYY